MGEKQVYLQIKLFKAEKPILDMEKARNIINKILFYGLFAVGIAFLFIDYSKISVMMFAFGSFIFSWIVALIFKYEKLNSKLIIFVNLSLWINLLGELTVYRSFTIPYYDKFLHLFIPIFITLIVYDFFSITSKKIRKEAVFLSVLGLLALWEIYEYFIEIFFGYPTMGWIVNGKVLISKLDDTMWDLILGAIGTIVCLIFKKEQISKKIKKDIKNVIR